MHAAYAVVAVTGGASIGIAVGLEPLLSALLFLAAALLVAFYRRPQWGAYAYTCTMPLIVGLNRGSILPSIRLNEALLALILVALLARAFVHPRDFAALRPNLLDAAVVLLVLTGSIIPLISTILRDQSLDQLAIGYALVIPKLAATYAVFRVTITSNARALKLTKILTATLALVALLGIAQTTRVPPVEKLLADFGQFGNPEASNFVRAASTIGSPLAFADLMVIGCGLSIAWLATTHRRVLFLLLLAGFSIAALLSGQVSAMIGLVLVPIVIGVATRRKLRAAIASLVGIVLIAPVAAQVLTARLASVDQTTGLPTGWTGDAGRLVNLSTYVLPRFSSATDFIFGVQLPAQLPSPYPWAEWLYIESGYVWALWVGGVPLLISVLLFLLVGVTAARRALSLRGSMVALGVGLVAMLMFVQIAILMWFDPHLTYRGSGDVLFLVAAVLANFGRRAPQPRLAVKQNCEADYSMLNPDKKIVSA